MNPAWRHQRAKTNHMIWSSSLYMPNDLITEILLYLHAKSLLRFTSLSKYWFSVIGSFISKQALQQQALTAVCVSLLSSVHFHPTYKSKMIPNPTSYRSFSPNNVSQVHSHDPGLDLHPSKTQLFGVRQWHLLLLQQPTPARWSISLKIVDNETTAGLPLTLSSGLIL